MEKVLLSGLTLEELQDVAAQLDLPKFAGRQMAQWLYGKQIFDISEMTNLSKAARDKLEARFEIGRRKPIEQMTSKDGTIKYLFPTAQGKLVETVYIPTEDRATLCVSSQVGCKMGCRFCMTGRQGFEAQLTTGDLLNQIYALPEWNKLTNIVFMGQGEPLDNIDAVIKACHLLMAPYGMAWSPKRITVSTVGDTRGLKRFLGEVDCNLAISRHFAPPEERIEWMPAEKAWPITETIQQLRQYDFCRNLERGELRQGSHQRRLSFEYIVFAGLNDSRRHCDAILRLLDGLDCRVNLIPFHSIPDSHFKPATIDHMKTMRDYLTQHGVYTTIRASRGQDIMAACGLLTTAKKERKREEK